MQQLMLKGMTFAGGLELSEGLVSIGRNPTNDYRLSDPTVSSFHCELDVSPDRILVRDLGSTNGTYIDDVLVREAVLMPGQTLRLGKAEMCIELVPEPGTDTVPDVRIPQIQRCEPATHLLDGRPACQNHPGIEAILRCTVCGRGYCMECVKPLGLAGGQKRLFCPACSQPCLPMFAEVKEKKPSLLGRLTQTIRIRLGSR
jgi:hypothetical protein